jgi:hypothetical protein
MHPKTHAKLMNMYYYFGLLVGIPTFFIVIIIAILWKHLIPLLAFFIITAILNIFFWSLPVRCEKPCCNHRMEMTKSYVATFRIRLHYECTVCNSFYETTSFELIPGEPAL